MLQLPLLKIIQGTNNRRSVAEIIMNTYVHILNFRQHRYFFPLFVSTLTILLALSSYSLSGV